MREDFIQEQKDGKYLVNGKWYPRYHFDHLQELTINGKNLLLEYYVRVSKDNSLLNGWNVWLYGNDRENNPPHCHLVKDDCNLEIHLVDMELYHMESPKIQNISWNNVPKKLKEDFFNWLNQSHSEGKTNCDHLLEMWDDNNEENTLKDFVQKRNLHSSVHGIVHQYLYGKKIDNNDITKSIFDIVLSLYQKDKEAREKLHKIALVDVIQFAQEVNLPFEFTEWNTTLKIRSIIQEYEKLCYELAIQK